jgi:hypothetical protein
MTSARSDANRVLAGAVFAAVGLWALIALTTWHELPNGVRFGLPWYTYASDQSLLFEGGVQVIPVLGAILLNILAGLVGYAFVVRPIWGGRQLASPVWFGFAGMVPGMLIFIALSRVVTLVLPNSIAPGVVLFVILAMAGFAAFTLRDGSSPRRLLVGLGPAVWQGGVLLLVVLIFSVQIDTVHVAGEGSVWFAKTVFLSPTHGIGTNGHWPLVSQHYDEAAFLYPVVYGLMTPGPDAGGTLVTIYWFMLAFGRLAIVAITYVAVRALGVDRLSSLILLMFVFGASLSLNPVSSRLLFDAYSPLGYVQHISRILVPVLPLLLVSMAAERTYKANFTACALALVLGIGLSAMTVHAVIVLMWAVGVAVLTLISPGAARSPAFWRNACVSCLVLIAAFTITYGVGGPVPAGVDVGILVGAAFISAALMAWPLLYQIGTGQSQDGDPGWLYLLIVGCCGYAVGLLLLGNIFIDKTYPVLSSVWPWSQVDVVERFLSTLASSSWSVAQSPYCDGGYSWMYRVLTGHCGSLPMFVRTYGLGLVAVSFVIAWWLNGLPRSERIADRTLTMVMWGLVLCLLAMTLGFILFDFVSPTESTVDWHRSLSIWLRSRLIEPWFYGGVLLAFALYFSRCSAQERHWVQALMLIAFALHTLNPLLLPAQLVANTAFLLAQITGG